MKATRINANQAQELINSVKSVIRLGGFETGLRTNLNKAIFYCKGTYLMTYSSPEYLFEKEYQLETKVCFTNFLNESYEIWFEESKIYTFENEGEKFLIVTGMGYCNVYQLIQKDENESFDDQPAITGNGDSKETFISYEGKTINVKCLLSNTKSCKWDKRYPENHNHYIVTVSYEGRKLSFDWFDSFNNFRAGVTDKSRKEMIQIFYTLLQDIFYKNDYSDKTDFCQEEGHTAKLWNSLCSQESNFNRVFEGINIYELASNLQETFDF